MVIDNELNPYIELFVDLTKMSAKLNTCEKDFLEMLFEFLREEDYSSNGLSFKLNELHQHFEKTKKRNLTMKEFEKLIDSTQTKIPCIITGDSFTRTIWYKTIINPPTDKISFVFGDEILDYVKGAYEKPNTIKLEIMYTFKKTNSIKLYAFLKKCMVSDKVMEINIDLFKDVMALSDHTGYKNFANLNLNVLEPAIEEINTKSELKVSCEPLKKGVKVESLRFKILN